MIHLLAYWSHTYTIQNVLILRCCSLYGSKNCVMEKKTSVCHRKKQASSLTPTHVSFLKRCIYIRTKPIIPKLFAQHFDQIQVIITKSRFVRSHPLCWFLTCNESHVLNDGMTRFSWILVFGFTNDKLYHGKVKVLKARVCHRTVQCRFFAAHC